MSHDDDARWDAVDEGIELLREGSLDAAVAELERVILEDPKNEHAYHFLGATHFEREDFERALKAYLTALELTPKHVGAMVGAGHALRMMGRTDEALRIARHARDLKAEDPDVVYLLGVLHFVRGETAA